MTTFLKVLIWVCIAGEGLWCFIAVSMVQSPVPTQLYGLCLLWLLLPIGILFTRNLPWIGVACAGINLIGCAYLKSAPGGVAHPLAYQLYYHSVDAVLLFAFAGLAWRLESA